VAFACGGCSQQQPPDAAPPSNRIAPAQQPYVLRRSGGPAGHVVEFVVLPAGGYTVRRLGPDGALIAERTIQRDKQPEALDFRTLPDHVSSAWRDLKGEYSAEPVGYRYEIRQAGRTVRFRGDDDVPWSVKWLLRELDEEADRLDAVAPPALSGASAAAPAVADVPPPSTQPAAPSDFPRDAAPVAQPADAAAPITLVYDLFDFLPQGMESDPERRRLSEDIIELLREMIPLRPLELSERDAILTATTPSAGHEQVASLLTQMRETRSFFSWVDAAVIQLEDDAPGPDVRTLRAKLSKLAFRPAPATRPTTLPVMSPARAAAPPAASVLDFAEYGTLLSTAESLRGVRVLRLPRLRIPNGHRGIVRAGSETDYVSGFRTVRRGGTDVTEPVRATLFEGAALDVTAVVTADRRGVGADLKLTLSDPDPVNAVTRKPPPMRSAEIRGSVAIPDNGALVLKGFVQSPDKPGGAARPRDDLFLLVRCYLPIPKDPAWEEMDKPYVR
jgi:hypothetical protein